MANGYQPVPLEQEAGTRNSLFAPVPVDYRDSGALDIPEPPETGTFVLTATDGVLSWEVSA